MPSTIKDTGGGDREYTLVPEGTHLARCVTVVNLGYQETNFGTKAQHYLGFEVPGVRVEWEKDGQQQEGPAVIGNTYTSSLNEKANLRKHLESWRGKAFTDEQLQGWDIFTCLGRECLISVQHNTSKDGKKTYANIASIMGVPPGMEVVKQETPLLAYDPDDQSTVANLEKMPQWLREKCEKGNTGKPSPTMTPPVQSENPAPVSSSAADPADHFDYSDLPF